MTGKLVVAADNTSSKLNIGNAIVDTSPTTTVDGDVWIRDGNRLTYKSNNAFYTTAALNLQNLFNQPQVIETTGAGTTLRLTQRGTGDAIRVEDDTTPDSTSFIVGSDGTVGIGLSSLSGINTKLTVVGNISATGIIYSSLGNSANWDSVYTTVNSNSADWDSTYTNQTNYLPLSGGTITGNLIASSLEINPQNLFTTLYVNEGKVGINTETPNVELTVNGSISSNNTIYDFIGNSNQWNSVYTSVNTNSSFYLKTSTASVIIAKSGDDLMAKYAETVALTPNGSEKSSINRASLVILPGSYSISSELVIDTEFVDIIGLGAQTQKPAIYVNDNTLNVTANDVRISGISVGSQSFKTYSTKPLQVFENCVGGDNSFAADTGYGIVDGKFINCIGGNNSFGSSYADGTFENCIGGNYSFGFQEANGTFKNCTGGDNSFARGGEANGEFINCTGGNFSFGGSGGRTNGIFVNCVGGNTSFAGNGIAAGTFTDCKAGSYSFGANSKADGIFSNCIGGDSSFGGNIGQMRGNLFNCRITSGTYNTPSGSGIIRLCIDGNNDVVNAQAI